MTQPFAGEWRIRRSIDEMNGAPTIVCMGSAHLHGTNADLVYTERVRFTLDGRDIRATRTYRFCTIDGAIVATFADGAPFFKLLLDAHGRGTAEHLCGPDLYTLTLTLREPATWHTRWDVSGSKRLRIDTAYERTR